MLQYQDILKTKINQHSTSHLDVHMRTDILTLNAVYESVRSLGRNVQANNREVGQYEYYRDRGKYFLVGRTIHGEPNILLQLQ